MKYTSPWTRDAMLPKSVMVTIRERDELLLDVIAGHRVVRERIRVVTMIVMAVHIVEQTAHMFAQGVIEYQHRVGLGIADRLRLLEQIREPPIIDALLEPGRLREEAGQIGFVSTLKHTAGDIRQAFVV